MQEYNELQAENALLRKIIGALIENVAGGEVIMTIGQLESVSPIDIRIDGEGRDDEVTICTLYPE